MKYNKKECIRCEKIRPIGEFEKKKSERNIRNVCIGCRKRNNKKAAHLKRAWLKTNVKPSLGTPCACCKNTKRKLVFDHCHEKNVFRGWICNRCNTAIGQLGDTLEGVMKAVRYLS